MSQAPLETAASDDRQPLNINVNRGNSVSGQRQPRVEFGAGKLRPRKQDNENTISANQ